MAGINRFDKPSTYVYRSPWQADDTQSITGLALSKQQQYTAEEDRRTRYALENAQLMNKIGGGDVAYKAQELGQIEQDLKGLKSEFGDLSSPEAKAAMDDYIINRQLKSRDALYEDTKRKYDESIASLSKAQYAPSHITYDIQKRQQIYNELGSQGLIDTYGSTDFGTAEGWENIPTISEELDKDFSKYKKQMLPGGNIGYSIYEIGPAAGFNVDGSGNLSFVGIPDKYKSTRGYQDLKLRAIEAVDNHMANNIESLQGLSPEEVQEIYYNNIENWIQNTYMKEASESVYKNSTEELSSLSLLQARRQQEMADKYTLKNDVAYDFLREENYNFSPKVAARIFRLNKYGDKDDGRYTTTLKGDVIVDPADVGEKATEIREIVKIDKNLNKYANNYDKLFGTDPEGTDGIRGDIADLTYRLNNIPGDGTTNPNYYQTISSLENSIKDKYAEARNILIDMSNNVGANIQVPELNNVDDFARIDGLMTISWENLQSQQEDLISKHGRDDIQYYKEQEELLDYIGQSLEEVNADVVVRFPAKGYNKVNIDGKPYAHLVAEIEPDIIKDIFNKFKKTRKLEKIEEVADWLNIKTDVDGNKKYVMDIYKDVSNVTEEDLNDGFRLRHPGQRLGSQQDQILGDQSLYMKGAEYNEILGQ